MTMEIVTDSDADMKAFAKWYRAKLLKDIESADTQAGVSEKDAFGLDSLKHGYFKLAKENLNAACETVMSNSFTVIRRLLKLEQKTLSACADEFCSMCDDSEKTSALRSRIEWLDSIRHMKLAK